MVDIKKGTESIRRQPSEAESAKWLRYQNRVKEITRIITNVGKLGGIATQMEIELNNITGKFISIWTNNNKIELDDLVSRIEILNQQIAGVYLKKYAVKFVNDDINIVALNVAGNLEEIQKDTYPIDNNNLNFGIAPIIVVAGIAAVTLLIGGDQAADRLESKAKIEAIRLQKKMVKANLEMAKAPEPQQKLWSKWMGKAAKMAEQAAKGSKPDVSFLDMLKQKGSTALVLVLMAAAGVLAYSKFGKKGDN